MYPCDPETPSTHPDATPHPEAPSGPQVERQFVTTSGVTVTVTKQQPPPPPQPELWEQAPRVVIRPPDPVTTGAPEGHPKTASPAARADREALRERDAWMRKLVAEHGAWLLRKLVEQGVGEESAKDLGQAALLVLADRVVEKKGPPSYVRGFLAGVARNVASNHKHLRRLDVDREADPDAELESAPDPLGMMELLEGWERMERYIDDLPKAERDALRCVDFEAQTLEEAALLLARPPGTVATHVRRARQRIEELARDSDRRAAT